MHYNSTSAQHEFSSSNTAFMTTEPYYREYFAGDTQAYAPTRSVYGDGSSTGGDGQAGGPQGATTYEGRFTTTSGNNNNNNNGVGGGVVGVHNPLKTSHNNNNNNTPVYAKTGVTAAGLTVDLPSPDSGIGTEAITPRDQNNIQQVSGETHTHTHSICPIAPPQQTPMRDTITNK